MRDLQDSLAWLEGRQVEREVLVESLRGSARIRLRVERPVVQDAGWAPLVGLCAHVVALVDGDDYRAGINGTQSLLKT